MISRFSIGNNAEITVFIEGGLGNQIFQYCAGKYLSLNSGGSLLLDIGMIGKNGTNHGFYLPQIIHDDKINLVTKTRRISISNRLISKLARESHSIAALTRKFGIYRSEGVGFESNLRLYKKKQRLHGYFQTWRYYQEIAENISRYIYISEPSVTLLESLESIKRKRVVCIHIRRGDYISVSEEFGLLDGNYYQNALKLLENKIELDEVWAFSDDIFSAKRLLDGVINKKIRWVDECQNLNPAETLFLMSQGTAIIIANSTFSYWAAILCKNQENVVAPAKWFRAKLDPVDLIPSTWNTIKSTWQP